MDIRKTVKKIAALVAGATMLGATIMGAAADLGAYPAPFVANGVFDGKIVVGANAATSDVVGAIDLAASLQAAATVTSEVEVPGVAGTTTVTGDSAEFKTGSDIPYIGEKLGTVKATFTESDLDGLSSGVFTSGTSSTPVKQYLKFENSGLSVAYEQDSDTDVSADFMKINSSDSPFFEYHMEFTEGAVSEVTSSVNLLDFESEVLNIMGIPYTIVDAKLVSSGAGIQLDLMGGEVADTLRDGETKTYTIDGKEYEVTAVFIDSTDQKAKLSVNGMLTKELAEGKTEVLGSDVTVGVQEILTNQREGLVEFYLGANKVELKDTNYANTAYAAGTVKVGGNRIDGAYLILKATNESGDIKLNYIKYKLLSDDDLWVPAGEGLKAYLTEPEAMLGDNWDIFYAGLTDPGVSVIKFDPVSSHSYKLRFTNLNGDEYAIPLMTDKSGATKGFAYGDNDDDFVFAEAFTEASPDGTTTNETWISDDDYFIVSDRATSATEDKAVTNVLRYKSLSTGDSTVTFEDLAGGTIVVSYTNSSGTVSGELIVAGASHNFWVHDNTGAAAIDKYSLAMDLDASGSINSGEVRAVAKGGAIIDFGTQIFNVSNSNEPSNFNGTTSVNITITTPASQFDESADGPEVIKVTLGQSSTANQLTGTVNGTLYEKLDDDKYEHRMTRYGAMVEKYTPTSSSAIEEITIDYPLVQRYGQVFVTMGTFDTISGGASDNGAIETTNINPIAVGLAVLDTDAPALGSENMIVVGGPCANTVAAELMGNPENCAEGFEPGKAVIKLFSENNALLVAGYEAQETLGACYVLADYEDYDLSGNEVEVVVADLNTITVNTVA